MNEQEKVLCASYALKKDARHWWRIVLIRKRGEQLTWTQFVEEFKDMYFNEDALVTQHDEFNNLQHGTMTVMEVVQKFEQLARL